MNINYRKLYLGRLEEISYQIAMAIRYKKWDQKRKLELEKQDILKKLNMG